MRAADSGAVEVVTPVGPGARGAVLAPSLPDWHAAVTTSPTTPTGTVSLMSREISRLTGGAQADGVECTRLTQLYFAHSAGLTTGVPKPVGLGSAKREVTGPL